MKYLIALFFITAILSCNSQPQDIVVESAELIKISNEFEFTEGPIADSRGDVYFTDQPNDRIMKYSIEGQLSTWMQPSGRSNGMYFDKDDNLWSCADEKNELWIIDQDQQVEVLLDSYQGGKLNGPNDLWIAPDGSVFFTDPFYKRPWWDRDTTQQDGQCVYYLSPDQNELIRIIDDLKQPNGIIGTIDGKTLYVADIGDNKTYSYQIGANRQLSGKKLFCEKGSDGMTLDELGNLYLTNRHGVTIFNKDGEQIEQIATGAGWTANVCFGGADMKKLFVTAMDGLYTIRMNVKGAGSQ